MAGSFGQQLRKGWNAFMARDLKNYKPEEDIGHGVYSARQDRPRYYISNERTIISSIYTRISIDVAAIDMRHVRLDKNDRYVETISSDLNECLTVEANLDQSGRAFRQDVAQTLFDKGVIAIVPVDTSAELNETGSFDIRSLRVGTITSWYPRHVRVEVYNEHSGRREELFLPKQSVAIIENPLYSVMNEPNSTLQRLLRKLSLLDAVDEQSSSGKLDLIIQLPYVIKSEARQTQADNRRKAIEDQLKGSQYGIAYTDGTEKITQLNRPAENNLLKQIEYLTAMLYSQLGLTEEIIKGTATEEQMLNYHNRTVEPILAAITDGIRRAFLTKTARTQGQSIGAFRDPFKLVAVSNIAEIADKFTRNEILSSNEVRGIIGFKPVDDPKAEQLLNKNLPVQEAAPIEPTEEAATDEETEDIMTQSFDEIDSAIDSIFADLGVEDG